MSEAPARPDSDPPEAALEIGAGLTVVAARAPGDALVLELVDANGPALAIVARPADPGTPARRRVGPLSLAHRVDDPAHTQRAERALDAVAAWIAGLEEPLRAALGRWLDHRPELPSSARPSPEPFSLDGLEAEVAPTGPGAVRVSWRPPSEPPTARLRAWRADALVAAEAGVQLAGVPRCMGGEPAPSQRERMPECARCLDQPSCAGGAGLSPPEALRPRTSEDAFVDVLALLGALEQTDAEALEACAVLRAAAADTPSGASSWELSWKLHEQRRADGARAVLYRRSDDAAAGLDAFAALAQARVPARHTLDEVCGGLPCHVGFASHPEGRSAKLYVQIDQLPDGLRGKRAQAIVERFGATLPRVLHDRRLYCIGLTLRPDGQRRVRAYEVVSAAALPDDELADATGGRAWDLSASSAPAPSAHFLHYEDAHLVASDLRDRLTDYPPHLAWLAGGLARSRARYYLNFIAHNRGGARTLYADVGPRARSLVRES